MIREFYPYEIKSKIRVYRDGKEVKPLMAVCIAMSDKEHEEVDGYIDLITVFRDKDGNMRYDEYGNPLWLIADPNLENDWYEENKNAKSLGSTFFPRPEPDIRRHYGKIRWELVK